MTAHTAGELAPSTLRERLAAGEPMTLLDVRNREEVERWRIESSSVTRVHVPYMKFVAAGVSGDVSDLVPADVEEPVVVVCPHGEASAEVADQLVAAGIDAENLAGGMDAWARLYDRTVVAEREGRTVYQYRRPASGCLGYAVVGDGEMAVVDPLRAFVDRYRSDAAELGVDLTYAVDTHVHADHVSGVRALAAATGAVAVLPQGSIDRGVVDAERFEAVADGDTLDVGGTAMTAAALPGHTTGMTGFDVDGCLLTGDSLFLDGVARPDLQEGADPRGRARELYATLTDRLERGSGETLIAPGHGEAGPEGTSPAVARLDDLRERLAVFGMDEAAFVDHATRVGAEPANAERIVAVNLGREVPDDDEAFELELGPNNCAAG